MKRIIQMTESELDIIINRAIWAGYCLHKNKPDIDIKEHWKEECAKERNHLKSQTMPGD